MSIEALGGIIGGLITVLGYFLVTKWQRRAGKRDEKLKKHFSDLSEMVLETIIPIIEEIRIHDGRLNTTSHNGYRITEIEMEDVANRLFPQYPGFEDNEQFECFKVHYPEKQKIWQKLKKRRLQHNKGDRAFENKIKEYIESSLNLQTINYKSPDIKEGVEPHTPHDVCQNLYQLAQNFTLNYDFTRATDEPAGNLRMIKVGATGFVITSTDKVEYCKSVLVDIQNSPEFRQEAAEIIKDAKQVITEFQDLNKELNHIKSRGLISKNPKYKFQPVKRCPICKELFY